MKKIIIAALIFASCSKQSVKPESVSNCGTIISTSSRDVTGAGNILKIENTLLIEWDDNSKTTVVKMNGNYKIGDQFCK